MNRPRSIFRFAFVPVVVFLSLSILVPGIEDYGITWDEAETNFPAARNQVDWWRTFLATGLGLDRESVRNGFETESDHPSLPRTWMAFGRLALGEGTSDRVAFAVPTALLAALFLGIFWWTSSRRTSILAATLASSLLLFHPRWFAHSHFAAYDLPIAAMGWLTAITFSWSVEATSTRTGRVWKDRWIEWKRPLAAGAVFGLAISVKLHAFFFPFPLLAWSALHRKVSAWRWAVACAFLGPAVYLGTQPYLWWDTTERMFSRFRDYRTKVPIDVYYLGDLYPGDLPWHYPWVMLWATLPVGFALFLALGLLSGATGRMKSRSSPGRLEWWSFLALNAATTPLLFTWKSPYDGVRLFLGSLPFLAALAAEGFELARERLSNRVGNRWTRVAVVPLAALAVGAQIRDCIRTHPDQTAYYSAAVGGIAGANRLGLETTYWCDSITAGFLLDVAERVSPEARVRTHAFDPSVLIEYQRAGVVPPGWTFDREAGPPDLRIVQFRQGFFGPLEWSLTGSRRLPLKMRTVDGVPLVQAYRGP